MKITAQRERLLHALGQTIGVIERKQTLPVLGNFLLHAKKDDSENLNSGELTVTGSDLEVEMRSRINVDVYEGGETTVPARKLFDICKAMPDGSFITIQQGADESKVTVSANRSRFSLSSLPADEFPLIEGVQAVNSLHVKTEDLSRLLQQTAFAMANQDVRYFLNGLLLELDEGAIRCVATDGHRLALAEAAFDQEEQVKHQIIIPRKGVLELQKLLKEAPEIIELHIGRNHISARFGSTQFTSKLIDGRFPDYNLVIPLDIDLTMQVNKEAARSAFQRASILSNEQYKGVKFKISPNKLVLIGHNPEQEESEEELEVQTEIADLGTGFNVNYLLDAINSLESEEVLFSFKDATSSCVVRDPENNQCRQVIMPLRL
jgi:DNA polymerase-3 subunit beta